MNRFLVRLIKVYHVFMSPLLVRFFSGSCRFYPTCSQYSIYALEKYGTLKGTFLSFMRFLSCHPLSNRSYFDPLK